MMSRDEYLIEIQKRAKAEKERIKKRNRNFFITAVIAAIIVPVGITGTKIAMDHRNVQFSSDEIITDADVTAENRTECVAETNAPPMTDQPTGEVPTGEPADIDRDRITVNGRKVKLINKKFYTVYSSDMYNQNEGGASDVSDTKNIEVVTVTTPEQFREFSNLLDEFLNYQKDDSFFDKNALLAVILPGYCTIGAYYESTVLVSDARELILAIPTPRKSEHNSAVFIVEIKKEQLNSYTSFKAEFYDVNEYVGG